MLGVEGHELAEWRGRKGVRARAATTVLAARTVQGVELLKVTDLLGWRFDLLLLERLRSRQAAERRLQLFTTTAVQAQAEKMEVQQPILVLGPIRELGAADKNNPAESGTVKALPQSPVDIMNGEFAEFTFSERPEIDRKYPAAWAVKVVGCSESLPDYPDPEHPTASRTTRRFADVAISAAVLQLLGEHTVCCLDLLLPR